MLFNLKNLLLSIEPLILITLSEGIPNILMASSLVASEIDSI